VPNRSQPKVGQCPSGYRESEGYCAPLNDRAPAAVPKIGSCPSGWTQMALTAPTLDGADVALQAREKHLHRGPDAARFQTLNGGVKPSDAPRSSAQQSASVGLFRGCVLDQQ
jgi:hypothetical protein